jgi:hypothetical protein
MPKQTKHLKVCEKCDRDLSPVTLYSPELLKIFMGGVKQYDKQGILISWSVCLNANCDDGKKNMTNYSAKKMGE